MKKQIIGSLVRFTFDDNVPALEFDCNKLSEANRTYAVPFGMCHRLGDMAAIQKSESNSFKVTEQMRHNEIAAGIAHYENPSADWNMKGTGQSHVTAKSMRAAAELISELTGCTIEDAMKQITEKAAA